MGGFSEISDISGLDRRTGPPHRPSGTPTADGWPRLPDNRLWSNGAFAGVFKHFNGLEKKTVMRSEDIHHTFDPVLSDPHPEFGQIDTVVDPVRATLAASTSTSGYVQTRGVDPSTTSGERT